MSKIYILEADPTRFGGIQQFVRNLSEYLPREKVALLSYYGDLAYEKELNAELIQLNNRSKCSWLRSLLGNKKNSFLSKKSLTRNIALLQDILFIRRNLSKLLKPSDTLVVNSCSMLLFFCSKKVLRNNRIILVQHNNPNIMAKRTFDFGGIFKRYKILLFKNYVDSFVMLSPYEKKFFENYLPLDNKDLHVIRHATKFPKSLPETTPHSVAVLSRLVTIKRVDRVIECAKVLQDVTFNIYGDGPERSNLELLAKDLPNVNFHGVTNDITMVFRENSALLITSLYEGYHLGGIECCAHGCAVVVLNTYPAARDLVRDGFNGRVLEEFDPESFSNAINDVLNNINKYRANALEHRNLYREDIAQEKWRKLLLGENR